jgi:hypothetical protein
MGPEMRLLQVCDWSHGSLLCEGKERLVVDPEVLAVFPNSGAGNEALRALALVLK